MLGIAEELLTRQRRRTEAADLQELRQLPGLSFVRPVRGFTLLAHTVYKAVMEKRVVRGGTAGAARSGSCAGRCRPLWVVFSVFFRSRRNAVRIL